MALHEFPDQRSVKFREDSYWRHLVLDQERLILRPFYEKCVEIITDVKGEKRTLADAFYIS
jgi:phosphoribosyl-ATP pyrophosphohydrolase